MLNVIAEIETVTQAPLTLIIYCTSFASLLVCFVFSCVLLLKLRHNFNQLTLEKKELFSKKRSTEVRTGHIVEKFAPFLEEFPYDPESAAFLGKPIDYIVFEKDMVRFLEVKSGGSQLNEKQRKIRDLIKDKKVSFETLRITDEGIDLKTHEKKPSSEKK